MQYTKALHLQFTIIILCMFVITCNNTNGPTAKELVNNPQQMDNAIGKNIQDALIFALKNNGKIDDSIRLNNVDVVNDFYTTQDYQPIWSSKEKWQTLADTLYNYIANAELDGLFSKDYHFNNLKKLKYKLDTDSLKRTDAALWTRADIMFTDAFMHIAKDLKSGRLMPDSISLKKDTALPKEFFVNNLNKLIAEKRFTNLINSFQPSNKRYWDLKRGLKKFVDSMDRHIYTYVKYPFKKNDSKDSIYFIKTLQKRLYESGAITFNNKLPDSLQLNDAIKKYQHKKNIKADGNISASLIKSMNTSDAERFKRIALTLDKYKQLPDTMPQKYIWVNLPGYYLWVIDNDTIAIESKIICGKPDTRTPLLNSTINNMVTYPTWTVPNSIIVKNYLPKLKNNPNYLQRLGLKLVNAKGQIIDGSTVSWDKYNKGIPYKVMQNSGDDNSLGIFKFNFNNAYAVYLHDTNQRYLFKNASRALSHGCVRVQQWQKLANFIAINDSINIKINDTLRYTTDSIKNWIANKENHHINVKNEIPLFIRYFGCETINGKIKFYEDIYGEDKMLREKYFADK